MPIKEQTSFSQVRRRSVEDEVYIRLREAILNGELEGGERLVHEDLAKRFGTSRIPVRDALKRLVYDGLIETDERGICYVSHFGLKDIDEIYSLREMLESYAVAKAVLQLTTEELFELERLQNEMEKAAQAGDRESYVALNHKFHSELYDSADLPRLSRIIHGLWQGLPPLTPMTIKHRMTQSNEEHRAIIEALRAKDADNAAAAMRVHIAAAGRALQDCVTNEKE